MKYVQILLYYVQDASLFKIELPSSDQAKETVLVKILKFSPDIVSNLYSHMENLCFGSGTTPVTKIIFTSMLGPCVMLVSAFNIWCSDYYVKVHFVTFILLEIVQGVSGKGILTVSPVFLPTAVSCSIHSYPMCRNI